MKFLGITSCATGIAHSYMAAEALEQIAKELKLDYKVEVQGALGIENRIIEEDLKDSLVIVFANDVKISDIERFEGFQDLIIQSSPGEAIRNTESLKEKILEKI